MDARTAGDRADADSLRPVEPSGPVAAPVDAAPLIGVLDEGVAAVQRALRSLDDLRRPGNRKGQYALDLAADEAICGVLLAHGLDVMSEESGYTRGSETSTAARAGGALLAVVDPVDGSTNASIGIPWFATSICVLDEAGPLLSLVVNLASGTRYEAVRGGGARRDGRDVSPSGCDALSKAVVGISGYPAGRAGWAQFRALGAASLDICAVAEGVLDGYRVAGRSSLNGWDYLAAVHVCVEAGAFVAELDGRDLVVRDAQPRRPAAAATAALLAEVAVAPV